MTTAYAMRPNRFSIIVILAVAGPASAEEEEFLRRHWPETIAPQGAPPAGYSELEAALDPVSCGACHPRQYRDWQGSRHSMSMGPGTLGQIVDIVAARPARARLCASCHTPLAEQQELIEAPGGGWRPNPVFDPALRAQGLACAGCHVRGHRRYGPPPRAMPKASGPAGQAALPHGGFSATSAFSRSGFCRGCHQFGPGDYALDGKPLENTYREWAESPYPARGVQCQTCHMPERRHLWRGIHDPEMVREGVAIALDLARTDYRRGDVLEATITVTNSGVGHYFPTYLTPKVFVRARLVNRAGTALAESQREAVIGREAPLDLTREIYDTRIPPGGARAIAYRQAIPADGLQLRVTVTVEPDHFYTRFYEALLTQSGSGNARTLIEQALRESRASAFVIFDEAVPIGGAPPSAQRGDQEQNE